MVDIVFESEELDEVATQWKEGVVNEKLDCFKRRLRSIPTSIAKRQPPCYRRRTASN